jgi:hypothetical protein
MNLKIKTLYALPVSIGLCLFLNFISGLILIVATSFIKYSNTRIKFRLNHIELLILLYILYVFIVYLLMGSSMFQFARLILFPFILYLFAISHGKVIKDVKVLKIFLSILILYSVLLFFRDIEGAFTLDIFNNIYMTERQAKTSIDSESSKFFKNATLVSIWLVTTFIFALVLLKETNNRIYYLVLVIFFALTFLSNTRSAIGALYIILFVDMFIVRKINYKIYLPIIIISIVLVFLSIQLYEAQFQYQEERFEEILDSERNFGFQNRIINYWLLAFTLINENIWGYSHPHYYSITGFSVHNDYIGQVVAVGLLFTLVYFYIIIYFLIKNIKVVSKRKNNIVWSQISLFMIITYLISSVTEQVTFSNPFYIAIMFAAMGLSKSEQLSNDQVLSVKHK